MGVFLRGDTYYYEFEFKGSRERGSCKTKNINTAMAVERKIREECQHRMYGIAPKKSKAMPTLREFGEETFRSELRMRHSDQEGTLDFYLYNFEELCKFKLLGNQNLDEISEDAIQKFTAHCAEKLKLSKSTINRRLATLRKAMRLAMKLHVIKGVPSFSMFREPPSRDYVLPRGTEEEFYLNHCPKHLHEFALLSLESGMRLGECLRLKWADVFFEAAGVGARPYIHCRGKKSRYADRKIPMSSRLLDHLKKMEQDKVSDWVLTRVRDRSKPASKHTLETAHEIVREKYKLYPSFVLHSLRHTMATRLGESGASGFAIQKVLGHSTIIMSQRYIHPTAGEIDRAFEMMDGQAKPLTPTAGVEQLLQAS